MGQELGQESDRRAQAPENLGTFVHVVAEWLRHNSRAALVSAVIGAAIGYLTNVFLLFVVYGGPQVAPGALAFGSGNSLWGSLSFGLAGMVFGALAGYWRAVGTQRFFHDLSHFPAALGSIVKRDGAAARVHLLWGAAVSLVAANLISPWVGLLLAAGLMSSLPSLLGRLVSGMVFRLWSSLAQSVTPSRERRPLGLAGVMVGMLGGALALCVGFLLPGAGLKLAFAGACAVAALVLSHRIPPSTAALLGFVAAELADMAWQAFGGSGFGLTGDAYAVDCKPGECVPLPMGPLLEGGEAHHHGPGAVLARSVGAGVAAGLGAWAGAGVGGALGAWGGGGGGGAGGDIDLEPRVSPPRDGNKVAPEGGPAITTQKQPPTDAFRGTAPAIPPLVPSVDGARNPPEGEPFAPPVQADSADDFPPMPDAAVTRAGLTEGEGDDVGLDAPWDTPETDDLVAAGGEGEPGEGWNDDEPQRAEPSVDGGEPASAKEPAMQGGDGPGDLPEPESPPPVDIEALKQGKRDKLHDIIMTLAGVNDVDKQSQLIRIVKNAAQVDDKGMPQGDLDRIATMVQNQIDSDQPPSALEEALQQAKDFTKGVGEDVRDLGKAAADVAKGVGQSIKNLATDPQAGQRFWDGAYGVVNKAGKAIDKGIESAVQSGKNFAQDVKDLATDQDFANDFFDAANQKLDQVKDKIKNVADEAAQLGKDVLNNPSILGDTLSGTLDDLKDPDKVAQAFRNGVPGGGLLLDAMDKRRPVTDRLKDALLGAAEWAGAADNVMDVADLAKGGAKLIKEFGSGLVDDAAGLGGNLAGKSIGRADDAAKAVSRAGRAAADDAGTLAGRSAKGAVAEGAGPGAIGKVDDAAAAAARKAEGAEDLLKAGDEAKRPPRTPGTPESAAPPPQGTVERGTHVRNILREEGYRPGLVERVKYEPTHVSGEAKVLGSTRGTGQKAESVIHAGAFDDSPTSLRSTTKHEVDHMLQKGQLETQAAPHGPKADWVDEQGKWTPKGKEMAEMDVRIQELDRNLVTRENALRRAAGASPEEKAKWLQVAQDADKEVAAARKWLSDHNVGKKTTTDAPSVEPAGEDLYKVGPTEQGKEFEAGLKTGENLNTLLKGRGELVKEPDVVSGRPLEGLQHLEGPTTKAPPNVYRNAKGELAIGPADTKAPVDVYRNAKGQLEISPAEAAAKGGLQGSEMTVIDRLVPGPNGVEAFASVAKGTDAFLTDKFRILMNATDPEKVTNLPRLVDRQKMLDFVGYKDAPGEFLEKAQLWVPADQVLPARTALAKQLADDPGLERFAAYRDHVKQKYGWSNDRIAQELLQKIKEGT